MESEPQYFLKYLWFTMDMFIFINSIFILTKENKPTLSS